MNEITDWQLERHEGTLLLGLSTKSAVLDILSDDETLRRCLSLLDTPPQELRSLQIGRFGEYLVTMNHHADGQVSIFVDGPRFSAHRCQSSATWIDGAALVGVLREVVCGRRSR